VAGVTVSFVAEPGLAARVREVARVDGVTQSQAAARAVAVGVLLPPAARRSLRLVMEEGGVEDQNELAAELSRAVNIVAHGVLDRQLKELARARGGEPPSEEEILEEATNAVRRYAERKARTGSRVLENPSLGD